MRTGEAVLRYLLVRQRGGGAGGGPGWIEVVAAGKARGTARRVSVAEAYAMSAACGSQLRVARATEALAARLPGLNSRRGAGQAARLREELAAARRGDRVAAEPLRGELRRALGRGESVRAVAGAAGFCDRSGSGDVSALKRRLGLEPYSQPTGHRTWAQTLAYEEAVRIARAVGADPVEVGV